MMGANGFMRSERSCIKRIVVSFPDDTFQEIRERAEKAGTSFAEEVRLLVEWGLEAGTQPEGK